MIAETIHLFALLSLRALADYDTIEFRRVTDLSTRELDRRLNKMLTELSYVEDKGTLVELETRLADLRAIQAEAESQIELTFHLRQLSRSTLEHAQRLALTYSRADSRSETERTRAETYQMAPPTSYPDTREDEFVRLGIMRLLRDLPEYQPVFDYRVKNTEIDAFLEPHRGVGPVIFVEGKHRLSNLKQARHAIEQLKKATAGWGRKSILVVLSVDVPEDVRYSWSEISSGAHLLIYDPESNDFAWQSHSSLLAVVRALIEEA